MPSPHALTWPGRSLQECVSQSTRGSHCGQTASNLRAEALFRCAALGPAWPAHSWLPGQQAGAGGPHGETVGALTRVGRGMNRTMKGE